MAQPKQNFRSAMNDGYERSDAPPHSPQLLDVTPANADQIDHCSADHDATLNIM